MIGHLFKFCLSFIISVLSVQVLADTVSVHQGYIRETIPGTEISSAYMVIKNHAQADALLIGAEADMSERLELHQHMMADGMMKMRQVELITVPANAEVELQPSGYHIMIFGLKNGLKNGEQHKITLLFADGTTQVVELPVVSIKQQQPDAHAHHHH